MMEAAELLTEKEISSSAIRALNRLEKGLREKGDDIKKKFSSMHNHLQKQLENVALFEPQLHFKFSTELKPAGL